jgi:drug/metabolite transporter (DMT)-like permease
MPQDHRTRAVLALFLCAVLWSSGGLFLKVVDWHPLAIAGGRGLIAGLFLLAVIRKPKFTWSRLQISAAVAYTACTVLFAVANKFTTAANAIVLQYTAPIYIALLSAWVLGERTTKADWFTIAATLAGMVLFFIDELTVSGTFGILVAAISGFAFAVMTLLLRKQKDESPVESIILGNLLAGAIGLPFMFAAPLPSAPGIGALLFLGVFQLGMPYMLYAWSIKRVTAIEAVLIPIVEPVLNPVWVLIFIGEKPGTFAMIGGAVVLGSVVIRALLAVSAGTIRTTAVP